MILIVGATGQLGTALVRRLAAKGERVRAFVRPTSKSEHLKVPNVELAFGDLRDADSLDAACVGADVIIATANTVAPRGGKYSFGEIDGEGYRNLLASAKRAGVKQFIFMSVLVTPRDDVVSTFRYKRVIEKIIVESGVPYTVFRGALFMDDWFALIGSSIPLRGCRVAYAQAAVLVFARVHVRHRPPDRESGHRPHPRIGKDSAFVHHARRRRDVHREISRSSGRAQCDDRPWRTGGAVVGRGRGDVCARAR